MSPRTRRLLAVTFAGVMILWIGWVLGSVYPLSLWPHSDCHRLGGALRAIPGPGKPTECVIPWADH